MGDREGSRLAALLLVLGMVLLVGGIGFGVFQYRMYAVLSDSMTPTLKPDDRIVSDTSFAGGAGIRRGDIVMLGKAAWPDDVEHSEIVKRVVAVGGDTVAFAVDAGRLTVNGRPVGEDYLGRGIEPGDEDFSVRVPERQVFVLGDNRPGSIDSRADRGKERGPVRSAAITGRVVAVAFPFDRFGEVPPTAAFGAPRGTDTAFILVLSAAALGLVLLLLSGAESLRYRYFHW